jgi:hypothetical protein
MSDDTWNGGVGFIEGREEIKPATSSDERIKELEQSAEEDFKHIMRQSALLTSSVNLIKGDPPELTRWSHHDLPELVKSVLVDFLALQLTPTATSSECGNPEHTDADIIDNCPRCGAPQCCAKCCQSATSSDVTISEELHHELKRACSAVGWEELYSKLCKAALEKGK